MDLGSGIRKKPIPDPGVKKASDPATLVRVADSHHSGADPDPHKKPDPDPHKNKKSDPDSQRSEKPDPIKVIRICNTANCHKTEE
jgi:hypothetical protein